MTSTLDSRRGRGALLFAHVAGMVDLVALPVWVGTLVQAYGLGPQRAGALVTLFLAAVVVASLVLAPRFAGLRRRGAVASAGYALAAASFLVAATTREFGVLALLHAVAGLGVGAGLSMVHGAIGRSANPHRLFAFAGLATGTLGVAFFVFVPGLIASRGGAVLFITFAALMLLAALATALAFPAVPVAGRGADAPPPAALPRPVWFVIGGVVLLTLNQALMFSFVERVGVDHGFGADRVNAVLIATGLINLMPGPLAAALQRFLPPRWVGMGAAIGQAALALTITQTATFGVYAVAASAYVFLIIFGHTFLFGLIAQLDKSGRAAASTSAMVMTGSAIGPFLGGSLVALSSYAAVGWAVTVIAALVLVLLARSAAAEREAETAAKPA